VKRTVFRLLDLALAVALSLALANVAQVRAAEWPQLRESDTIWPGAPLGDAQWPKSSEQELARTDTSVHDNSPPPASLGGEAEAFINYKVFPHFDIGPGLRYWSIFTNSGSVDFGPTFTPDFSLVKFITQRYGLILQAKATF
jgi:hypothetical protein